MAEANSHRMGLVSYTFLELQGEQQLAVFRPCFFLLNESLFNLNHTKRYKYIQIHTKTYKNIRKHTIT
jgi:hypothetical protein